MHSAAYMVSVALHFPPDVRHDLFVSLLVIEFVLLITEQSLQHGNYNFNICGNT